MKGNKAKELVFMLPLAAMWIVYLVLKDRLPAEVGSHFHIEDSQWVADGYMAPLGLMFSMTFCYVIVYGSMSLTSIIKSPQVTDKIQAGMRLFKAGILIFLSLVTVHILWGGVQGAASSSFGTGLILFLLIFVNVFIFFIFRSVRKSGERLPLSPTYYNIIWAALHLFTSWIMISGLSGAAGLQSASGRNAYLVIFAFLAILGNMMYNIKPNYFIGIRTPWTLKNEEVWKRTHRFGSVAMFGAGLGAFVYLLASPADSSSEFLLPLVVVIGAVIPAIYSYIVYRQVTQTNNNL